MRNRRLPPPRTLLAAGLALPLAWAGTAAAQLVPGHRLPEGVERPVRERTLDVTAIRADLRFDMQAEEIAGTLELDFTPLRAGTREVSLDASELEVESVESLQPPGQAPFAVSGRTLQVTLPRALEPGESGSLKLAYRCRRPRTGMYFQPAAGGRAAQAWNYGETGLHYAWLPLYNDTNDRFTVSLRVTVPAGLVALGNGRPGETRENPDGTRSFVWEQQLPIPNYLLALDVGEFRRVPLADARLKDRSLPLAAWTSTGYEDAAARTFAETPRMVEFFSERFGYDFPWAKYDQVALREFQGAMETTSMVGFEESYLHRAADPEDGRPSPLDVHPTWTSEDVIAHELAHHWFGDLVTCRSLGSIWLNESFASFAHLLWSEHAHGADDFAYRRWLYLNTYLDYVRRTGEVRPLEYLRYDSPDKPYQEETTYVKGSLVLHSLRHLLGDEAFFRGIAGYLRRHAYDNVEARDLQASLEAASGRNLSPFFSDWIVGGGGHPALRVASSWSPERKQVDLTLKQVQADQPFENAFRLPVDVRLLMPDGPRDQRVELQGWTTRVALPAEQKPLAVVFDAGGWLVAEVEQERSLEETLYVLDHGGTADRLRAARQLGTGFGRVPEAGDALARVLADPAAHWGLRQETALDLGSLGTPKAVSALVAALGDRDRRVRRAAAVALPRAGGGAASEAALRRAAETDAAEDVVAAALASLGRLHASGAREYLRGQLARESRWWDAIRIGALTGLAELQDASLAPDFEACADPKYNRQVRETALRAWRRAAPEDPALAARLRELTGDRVRSIQVLAVELLGGLHHAEDVALLRRLADHPDTSLGVAAREAADEIEAFAPARRD